MCGIVGAINVTNSKSKAATALKKIQYRGMDNTSFINKTNISLGHCLHSVVGNTPQPIEKDNYVFGANCEIYNWKELKKKHKLDSKNDAELLFDLLIKELKTKPIDKILPQLDGVFAFFLYNNKETILARDILGVKPLWFHYNKSLEFASERKALKEAEELNPRKIITYNNKTKQLKYKNQDFYKLNNKKPNKQKIKQLIDKALEKRIPNKNLGLLFSAGLDSTLLAHLLKRTNFTAYMTIDENKKDKINEAKKIAKLLNFKLKIIKINKQIINKHLPEVINLIESSDPIKVEVGLTMYLALREAKKDKIKVILSGVGADDIFAGYKRMLMYSNVNEDSLSNLRRLYERDLYRDDILAMANNIELRLPYLDHELVQELLSIDSIYKISNTPKQLLRDIAKELGLPTHLTELKRQAAQYSSGIGNIISKIVKENNYKHKAEYFKSLSKSNNIKLGVLFSSGKDSAYAMHIQKRLNYPISCLITLKSKNKDSYMFHTPTINITKQQARALQLPIITQTTTGKKENELEDLKRAIKKAKQEHNIQGIVTGALYSNYQRTRIENICDELNLKCYSPLWHVDQEQYLRGLVREGFEVIITKIAAEGLDESWLGKTINTQMIDKLSKLKQTLGLNPAGEGGEYETLVLDCPMFNNKLKIIKQEKMMEKENTGTLIVKKIK
jgi:diphthine-ammonia ligase